MGAWGLVFFAALVLHSIATVWFDVRFHQLPNYLTLLPYPLFFGLAYLSRIVDTFENQQIALVRMLLASVISLTVYLVLYAIGRGNLGLGDVKLAPLIGMVSAYQSWNALGVGLLSGFVAAGLGAAALLLFTKASGKTDLAFGPYMVFGMWLAILQIG